MNNTKQQHGLGDIKEYMYSNKRIIGDNILKLINYRGYTKSSFSKITGVSRPTIDKMLGGEIDNSTTFKTHIDKILSKCNIKLDELINFQYEEEQSDKIMVASNNAPKDYQMSENAKRIFQVIDDLVDICEIYGRQVK